MKVLYLLLGILAGMALLFLGVYFDAWHQNAVNGAKYDLTSLVSVGQLMATQTTGLVVNHSLFNTRIPALDRLAEALAAKLGVTNESKEDNNHV